MQDLSMFRGNEVWVGDFLRLLPEESILRRYVLAASKITDANAGLHIPAGLVLLSQIGPSKGLRLQDGTLNNLYAVLMASAGARKTECLKIARKVAERAGLTSMSDPPPGSREGFIDSLDVNHGGSEKRAVLYEEFKDFLVTTQTGGRGRMAGHAQSIRASLMTAYDGSPMERQLAARRNADTGSTDREVRGARYPVVSLLGAANYHVLSQHTGVEDWRDGFMGRFFLMDGEMERFHPRIQPWPYEMDGVIATLRERHEVECQREQQMSLVNGGLFPDATREGIDPNIMAGYDDWATTSFFTRPDNDLVAVAMKRLQPLSMRVALLLSWDYGLARAASLQNQSGWFLTDRELSPATWLVERHLDAYKTAVANVVLHDEERPIRDVEIELRTADNNRQGLTIGEISQRTSRTERTVRDALITLMCRGTVRERQRDDTATKEFILAEGLVSKIASVSLPATGVSLTAALNASS